MRVLHFYPKDNDMVAQYVETLCSAMDGYADVSAESSFAAFKKSARERHPDIVHLHGCWRWANALAMQYVSKFGTRIVLSPHGGLEPWVVRQHFWKEKLPKLFVYQRRILRKSFAVIAQGRMEADSIAHTRLNPRIETVRNALITSTVTPQQMADSIHAIYRKVLDSFTWPLMASDTAMALRAFVKAGQTGDANWLSNEEYQSTKDLPAEAWRQLLLFAHQEDVGDTVRHGIAVVGLEPPEDIHPAETSVYQPTHRHKKSGGLDTHGDDEAARLVNAIHSAQKLLRGGQLTLAHAAELCTLFRNSQADEERLAYRLRTKGLQTFTRRLMAVLEDLTGLEEGMMPTEKLDDKEVGRMKRKITNRNEIL